MFHQRHGKVGKVSLREGIRGQAIWLFFGLTPEDKNVWCIWEQFIAIEKGWA
jgi:hypothetical protein